MKTKVFFRRHVMVPYIVFIVGFILMCFLGYYICSKNLHFANSLLEEFMKVIKEGNIVNEQGQISPVNLFLNNLKASAVATVIGFVPFLFLPIIVLVSNGLVTGSVFAVLGQAQANLWLYVVAGILPHGILEIPAVCLGITLGFVLCLFICQKILNKGRLSYIKAGEFFKHLVKIFAFVIVPLLVLAAAVETYVTPMIMEAML